MVRNIFSLMCVLFSASCVTGHEDPPIQGRVDPVSVRDACLRPGAEVEGSLSFPQFKNMGSRYSADDFYGRYTIVSFDYIRYSEEVIDESKRQSLIEQVGGTVLFEPDRFYSALYAEKYMSAPIYSIECYGPLFEGWVPSSWMKRLSYYYYGYRNDERAAQNVLLVRDRYEPTNNTLGARFEVILGELYYFDLDAMYHLERVPEADSL